MDFLIEFLLDVYMELMFLIIPEEKRTKKHYFIVKIVAIVLTLGMLALGLWGFFLVYEYKNPWGWLPLCIAIALSIVQIVFGILGIRKK